MASTEKALLAILLLGAAPLAASNTTGCAGAPAPEALAPPSVRPAQAATSAPVDAVPPPRDDGRLPSSVKPTRYALDLTIDPSKATFSGRTRIGVAVEAP